MDYLQKHLIFLPLEIPPLEFNRRSLETWYDANKTRGMEEYVAKIGYPWNVVWLRDEDKGIEWREDIETIFPNFYNCLSYLPHQIFRKVYILEQVIDVEPHRDVSREDDESLGPSTYRAMLINDDPETFYYLRGPNKDDDMTRHYPTFPRPGMWFVHNNYNSRHGARMPVLPNRKLIFCVWGNVERAPHEKLVEISYEKYQEYAL